VISPIDSRRLHLPGLGQVEISCVDDDLRVARYFLADGCDDIHEPIKAEFVHRHQEQGVQIPVIGKGMGAATNLVQRQLTARHDRVLFAEDAESAVSRASGSIDADLPEKHSRISKSLPCGRVRRGHEETSLQRLGRQTKQVDAVSLGRNTTFRCQTQDSLKPIIHDHDATFGVASRNNKSLRIPVAAVDLLVTPAELVGRFALSVKISLHFSLGWRLFVAAVLMLIAGHPGIAQGASEPVLDHRSNIARASSDNLDALGGKDINRPLPHIAR